MKTSRLIRISAILLALVMLTGATAPLSVSAAGYSLPADKTLYADAAILVSLGSTPSRDSVVFDKNADEAHAPGAMMRFMVAAYALRCLQDKNIDPDAAIGTYTADIFNRYVAGTGVPTANMKYDETWTVRQLLTASFMQNASDAVHVLAIAVDGSVENFLSGMNALAREIGCECSHFSNLTGLDSVGQYTTPRDMAKIIRYGQSFPAFEDIVSTRQLEVTPVSGGTSRTLTTVNNMMLPSSTFYYSPLVYGRTGLSDHEGRCCASVARDSGYEYLAVVMGDPERAPDGQTGLHFMDSMLLYRWAYNTFSYRTILPKSEILASVKVDLSWSTDHVNLVPEDAYATVVENALQDEQIIKKITVDTDRVSAPVEKGTVLGKVELVVNVDQKIGEVPLVAADTVERSFILYAWRSAAGFFASGWFWLGVVTVILLIAGYIALNVAYNRRRQKKRLNKQKPSDER